MDEPSVELLEKLRTGDEQAADELFRRYLGRLTVLARARMAPKIARRFDPEDVVLSAYRSFFVRARNGRFSLEHSGDLWRLLVGIVLKKLAHQVARNTADKRSVDREEPGFADTDSAWFSTGAVGRSPTAEQAVELADVLEVFMEQLDARSRWILELRLHDQRIEEIAAAVAVNEKTVRRTLVDLESRLRVMLVGPQDTGLLQGPRGIPRAESNHPTVPSASQREHAEAANGIEPARLHPAPERAAEILSDRDFVIELHVGSGGTGRVYRARRKKDDSLVAIKMLRKAGQRNPTVVARFLDEARTVARLYHPQIVAIRGIGRTRAGGYFLVQDLVQGVSLADVIQERRVATADAMRWIADAAEALGHAHRQGVVHCDLKPANLLLDTSGRILVTDFGFAQLIAPRGTSPTGIGGTFGYMAPEQLDPAWGTIGPSTDVFGLGAVLFALMTGHAPFSGKSMDKLLQTMLENSPSSLLASERPELHREIGVAISRCLALNPRERFQSAAELANSLRPFGTERS